MGSATASLTPQARFIPQRRTVSISPRATFYLTDKTVDMWINPLGEVAGIVNHKYNKYMEPYITARVHKTGTSFQVVLPKTICRSLGIDRGDELEVRVARGGLIVFRKVQEFKRLPTIKF